MGGDMHLESTAVGDIYRRIRGVHGRYLPKLLHQKRMVCPIDMSYTWP